MNKKKPFVATWMELEIIIPNEVNQKEKDEYHMISLIYICVCVCVTDNNKVLLYNTVNYILISCDKP